MGKKNPVQLPSVFLFFNKQLNRTRVKKDFICLWEINYSTFTVGGDIRWCQIVFFGGNLCQVHVMRNDSGWGKHTVIRF